MSKKPFIYLFILILLNPRIVRASVMVAFFRSPENSLIAFKDIAIKIGFKWVHYGPDGMNFFNSPDEIDENYLLMHSFTNLSNLTFKQIKFWSKAKYKMFSDYNDLTTLSGSKLVAHLLEIGQSDLFPYMPDDIYKILKEKGFKIINKKKRIRFCNKVLGK